MDIQQLGVVGAGQMGGGIAQVCAMSGLPVVLYDLDGDSVDRSMAAIQTSLERLIRKGTIRREQSVATLDRITGTRCMQLLSQVDIVVEAVTENEDVKRSVFCDLDQICKSATILATNTSSISITRLAAVTSRPEQVIGMHFMNPVPVTQLVEIIQALQTDPEVLDRVTALVRRIGKVPVNVCNAPGFVANRIVLPMINEAIYCLHERLARAEDVDQIMKLGMGHPIGPLALADLIGLDTCLNILKILYCEFMDTKYRPCPLLVQMVDAGYLGRKSGRGFYTYVEGDA